MGINYCSDLNKKIINNETKDIFLMQEALHEKRIAQIADEINKRKAHVVLICGPSSSGKTTFANRLIIQFFRMEWKASWWEWWIRFRINQSSRYRLVLI